jgi:hypothetical protein
MRWLLLATLFVLPCLSAQTFDLPGRGPRPALFEIDRAGGLGADTDHELGQISFGGSAGIAVSPLGFLATVEADFWFTSYLSIGPLVQVVAGEKFILGVGGGAKFTLDFGHEWSEFVKPYVHAGPGFAVVSGRHDGHRGTHIGLLLTLGLGVDIYFWDDISLGTGVLFNFLPLNTAGETFYFGWKVIEVKVHF